MKIIVLVKEVPDTYGEGFQRPRPPESQPTPGQRRYASVLSGGPP